MAKPKWHNKKRAKQIATKTTYMIVIGVFIYKSFLRSV